MSLNLANHEIFRAKVGKGGIKFVFLTALFIVNYSAYGLEK